MEEGDLAQQPTQQAPAPVSKKNYAIVYLLLVAFVLSLVYIVYNEEWHKHNLTNEQQHTQDSLIKSYNYVIAKAQSDSLAAAKKIVILVDSTNSLTQQINANNNDIQQVKTRTIVKIKYVAAMPDSILAPYFISLVNAGYIQGK